MLRRLFCFLFLVSTVIACKHKSRAAGDAADFFPVVSYLRSQIRHIDTSLYSLTQITTHNGSTDTAYLRREDFSAAAQDFLSLPDLNNDDLRSKYAETKLYDEDLKKVVLSYAPKDGNDFDQITRQDVLIEPGDETADQVQTIYIETLLNKGDSAVQKKLTWNVAKGFQVIRVVTRPGTPEVVQTTDVSWRGAP